MSASQGHTDMGTVKLINCRAFCGVFALTLKFYLHAHATTLIVDNVVLVQKHESRPFAELSPHFRVPLAHQENDPGTLCHELATYKNKARALVSEQPSDDCNIV